MSLATRCTACGTVFRVVQDQLKVSQGWVRCGRCSEVFNAMEALFDLERDTPAQPADATRQSPVDAPSHSLVDSSVPGSTGDPGEIDLDVGTPGASDPLFEPFDARLAAIGPTPVASPFLEPDSHQDANAPPSWDGARRSTTAERVEALERRDFPDARFGSEMLSDADASSVERVERAAPEDAEAMAVPALEASEPHFVLHAQRRAHWQSPRMLALQGAALALLLALLGLQVANHFRDSLAARSPVLSSALSAWCGVVSCALQAPRRLDDLVVESSALTRAGLPDAFKLSVVLRNRGNLALMPPSVDLSLTDAAGQPVSRRMLSPRDFQVSGAPLRPGLEAPWQLVLTTAAPGGVVGYTVEVFYP